jgi:hypothetical protein
VNRPRIRPRPTREDELLHRVRVLENQVARQETKLAWYRDAEHVADLSKELWWQDGSPVDAGTSTYSKWCRAVEAWAQLDPEDTA